MRGLPIPLMTITLNMESMPYSHHVEAMLMMGNIPAFTTGSY